MHNSSSESPVPTNQLAHLDLTLIQSVASEPGVSGMRPALREVRVDWWFQVQRRHWKRRPQQ